MPWYYNNKEITDDRADQLMSACVSGVVFRRRDKKEEEDSDSISIDTYVEEPHRSKFVRSTYVKKKELFDELARE